MHRKKSEVLFFIIISQNSNSSEVVFYEVQKEVFIWARVCLTESEVVTHSLPGSVLLYFMSKRGVNLDGKRRLTDNVY